MNSRLLLVATVFGAVCIGSAYGVDRRDELNNRQPTNANTYGTQSFGLPNDPTQRYDPFAPQTQQPSTNRFINDGRNRFDMVSFPGGGITPGTPLITNPATPSPLLTNPTGIQPQVAPNPSSSTTKNRWRIGIYSRNTDTGVSIMRIVPNSPANIAGLEPNDKIIAVGGYQVGIVDGIRHDLGAEFDLRCDENGATSLLVQDSRDGSLVNLDVQLEPRFATVTGEITWRSNTRLPHEAFAQVELRERIRPGAPVITIAQQMVYALSEQQKTKTGRVPFQIEYSQTDIDPTREYFVTATIVDNYRTLYTTERPFAVITRQNPRRVDVTLAQVYDWGNQQSVGNVAQTNEYENFARMFQKYMGRQLRPGEAEVYRNDFDHGQTYNDAMVDFISGQEFYTRSQNDDRAFIIRAHQAYTGQMPSEKQIQYWINQLQGYNGLRREFARDFIANLN